MDRAHTHIKLAQESSAFVALLMAMAVGDVSSLAVKNPQELIKVFALFLILLLALGRVVHAVILRKRTAVRMGHVRRHDLSRMLQTLSKLAMFAAAVAVHRLLPYLTDISRDDGDDRHLAIIIALALAFFIALALASWWLLMRQRGRAWRSKTVVMAAAHGEIHGRRNRALEKIATTALASMFVSAACILPILTEKTSEDGRGIVSMCRLFALFTKFVLASGFLVATVLLGDMAFSAVATHAAVMAVTMMILIDIFMVVGVRVVASA